jgi:polar amino acid transport system substrate-binding protein
VLAARRAGVAGRRVREEFAKRAASAPAALAIAAPPADRVEAIAASRFTRRKEPFVITRRSLISLLCLAGLGAAAHAQNALENIEKTKVVRIGVPADTPPFGFKAADGQLRGLDIDMANLVAAKLGASAKLVVLASAERIPALQQDKVDLVISTLGKNPEREKVIDFAKDYSSFYLAVFGPKSLAAASTADLAGKSVAVTKGSIEDQELTKVAPASARIERFDNVAAAVEAYSSGKAQLLAAGVSVAAAATQTHAGLEADAKFVLKDSRNFIGLPKGEDALRARVDKIVDDARASGELLGLGRKWFSRTGLAQH